MDLVNQKYKYYKYKYLHVKQQGGDNQNTLLLLKKRYKYYKYMLLGGMMSMATPEDRETRHQLNMSNAFSTFKNPVNPLKERVERILENGAEAEKSVLGKREERDDEFHPTRRQKAFRGGSRRRHNLPDDLYNISKHFILSEEDIIFYIEKTQTYLKPSAKSLEEIQYIIKELFNILERYLIRSFNDKYTAEFNTYLFNYWSLNKTNPNRPYQILSEIQAVIYQLNNKVEIYLKGGWLFHYLFNNDPSYSETNASVISTFQDFFKISDIDFGCKVIGPTLSVDEYFQTLQECINIFYISLLVNIKSQTGTTHEAWVEVDGTEQNLLNILPSNLSSIRTKTPLVSIQEFFESHPKLQHSFTIIFNEYLQRLPKESKSLVCHHLGLSSLSKNICDWISHQVNYENEMKKMGHLLPEELKSQWGEPEVDMGEMEGGPKNHGYIDISQHSYSRVTTVGATHNLIPNTKSLYQIRLPFKNTQLKQKGYIITNNISCFPVGNTEFWQLFYLSRLKISMGNKFKSECFDFSCGIPPEYYEELRIKKLIPPAATQIIRPYPNESERTVYAGFLNGVSISSIIIELKRIVYGINYNQLDNLDTPYTDNKYEKRLGRLCWLWVKYLKVHWLKYHIILKSLNKIQELDLNTYLTTLYISQDTNTTKLMEFLKYDILIPFFFAGNSHQLKKLRHSLFRYTQSSTFREGASEYTSHSSNEFIKLIIIGTTQTNYSDIPSQSINFNTPKLDKMKQYLDILLAE